MRACRQPGRQTSGRDHTRGWGVPVAAGSRGRSPEAVAASRRSLCSHPPLSHGRSCLGRGLEVLDLCMNFSPASCPAPVRPPHGRPTNLPEGQICSCKHTLPRLRKTSLNGPASLCRPSSPAQSSACLCCRSSPPPARGSAWRHPRTWYSVQTCGARACRSHGLETSQPHLCQFKSWPHYSLVSDLEQVT